MNNTTAENILSSSFFYLLIYRHKWFRNHTKAPRMRLFRILRKWFPFSYIQSKSFCSEIFIWKKKYLNTNTAGIKFVQSFARCFRLTFHCSVTILTSSVSVFWLLFTVWNTITVVSWRKLEVKRKNIATIWNWLFFYSQNSYSTRCSCSIYRATMMMKKKKYNKWHRSNEIVWLVCDIK